MDTVSLTACQNYNVPLVYHCIKKSIENIGGLQQYIKPGDKVFLKVNMLMKKKPEQCATTHPAVVEALCTLLIEHGASVTIGDSPGGPFNQALLSQQYQVCGFTTAAKNCGATLNENTASMTVKNKNGLLLKQLTVAQMMKGHDKIISLSKLKTHGMMTYTGAVKNMFGIIPGTTKADYHLRMPKTDNFADALIDICSYAAPVLSIMDAVTVMEGNGPSAGTTRKMGAILASASPYALDVVATRLICFKPSTVPTVKRSIQRELVKPYKEIELVGDDIKPFILRDFKRPTHQSSVNPLGRLGLKPVNNLLGALVKPRPVFNHQQCVGCGDCAKNCPPKVIKLRNKKPHVRLNGCISCFCCQELCPVRAIEIKQPALHRSLFGIAEKRGALVFNWITNLGAKTKSK